MNFNENFIKFSNERFFNLIPFSHIINEAQVAIENNRIDIIKDLLLKDQALANEASSYFLFTTLIEYAIELGTEEIAFELYKSLPEKSALYPYKIQLVVDYSLNTDLLGLAIYYERYNLIKNLMDTNSVAPFNVDGLKNTPNIFLNCYSLIKDAEDDSALFPVDSSRIFLSSPFLLSIVVGNWEIYQLLKSHDPYFNHSDKNCQEHLNLCQNTKIINDL